MTPEQMVRAIVYGKISEFRIAMQAYQRLSPAQQTSIDKQTNAAFAAKHRAYKEKHSG